MFNKGLAPSFNVASRSEAAMKFQLGIEPQLKLNMEPAALEAGDILPKLYHYKVLVRVLSFIVHIVRFFIITFFSINIVICFRL